MLRCPTQPPPHNSTQAQSYKASLTSSPSLSSRRTHLIHLCFGLHGQDALATSSSTWTHTRFSIHGAHHLFFCVGRFVVLLVLLSPLSMFSLHVSLECFLASVPYVADRTVDPFCVVDFFRFSLYNPPLASLRFVCSPPPRHIQYTDK